MQRHPTIFIRMSSGAGSYDFYQERADGRCNVYGDMPFRVGVSADPLGGRERHGRLLTVRGGWHAELQPTFHASAPAHLVVRQPIRWSDWLAANGLGRHPQTPATGFDRGALVVSAAIQGMGVARGSSRPSFHRGSWPSLVKDGSG